MWAIGLGRDFGRAGFSKDQRWGIFEASFLRRFCSILIVGPDEVLIYSLVSCDRAKINRSADRFEIV